MTAAAQSRLEEKQAWMRERHMQPQPVDGMPNVTAFEWHYSPKELSDKWGLDAGTIRRIFQDRPGVLKHGKSQRRDGKRDYMTIRIPESLVLEVHSELSR